MKIKPPFPVIGVTVAYLASELWELATEPSFTVAIRLSLSVLLFYFVLRGSRVAGNILAVLCLLSVPICIYAAVAFWRYLPKEASLFALASVFLLAFAAYMFFSPAVRRFQLQAPSATGTV